MATTTTAPTAASPTAATTRATMTPLVSWDKAQQQLKPVPKKNNSLLTVAVVAIVLLAVTGLWRTMNRPSPRQFIQVMAAQRDITAGSRLGITNIRFLDVPKQFASQDMIYSLNDATGHVARTFIPAGEPIKNYMLFPGHEGVSVELQSNERAITLQLDDDALVDHSIMPDDRVDLLVVSNKDNKKFTKTICQAVRVLMAVSKEQLMARRGGTAGNKITLAVSPDLTETITEAAETGKIRLVLRNRVSRSEKNLAGVGPEALLPAIANNQNSSNGNAAPADLDNQNSQMIPPPPPGASLDATASAPGPLQWMVEVISGSHKENYAVPEK